MKKVVLILSLLLSITQINASSIHFKNGPIRTSYIDSLDEVISIVKADINSRKEILGKMQTEWQKYQKENQIEIEKYTSKKMPVPDGSVDSQNRINKYLALIQNGLVTLRGAEKALVEINTSPLSKNLYASQKIKKLETGNEKMKNYIDNDVIDFITKNK